MPAPAPPRLHPDTVREHLAALRLSPANHQALATLLALDWAAGPPQVLVERVHAALYADKPLANANKALVRLVEAINDAAELRKVPLKAQVSPSKRGGAANRYLWFEVPRAATVPARMDESSRIPVGARIDTQRGRPAGTDLAPTPAARPPARHRDPPAQRLPDVARDRVPAYVDLRAARTHLHKGLDLLDRDTPAADPEPVVALDYLQDWVDDPSAPPLFALLGEYGLGKTVTCQTLKRRLDQRREADASRPLALYFDLRLVTDLDRRVPTLKQLCEECMERGWQGPAATGAYGIEDVIRWAAAGAVVIFDGLDEVLVKLTAADGQAFTRTLLGLATLVREKLAEERESLAQERPPVPEDTLLGLVPSGQQLLDKNDKSDQREESAGTGVSDQTNAHGPRPRLLISCRTHYFRTLRDQQNHFTGQERAGPDANAFRALVLLPLTGEQVRGYFAAALPDQDPDRILATVAAVHNLTELTQRPYTLKLVADQLPAIEARRLAGRPVYGTTLYGGLVQHWLERDSGKHHIHPDHKLRLAAYLAAHLWREGSGMLSAARLESWFHAWLEGEPDLRPRYARLHPDQLEEDLRTATFLVREDGAEGSAFRFAHTSLLEYFLADYLIDAIRADAPERWALPMPSPETLDFLGQRLAEAAEPALLATPQHWRTPYRPRATELLLAYVLRALERGWPLPNLRGLALTGMDLSDLQFRTPAGRPALDLSEADFTGAVLRRVVFAGVRLTGACFRAATLTQATLLDCDTASTEWVRAQCDGTVWRDSRLTGSTWTGASGRRWQFVRCDGAPVAIPGVSGQLVPRVVPAVAPKARSDSDLVTASAPRPSLRRLTGHTGGVTACAFAPTGGRLLSAGEDGALRLWDAASGEEILYCGGHLGPVYACAFSPDGMRLLSAGQDGTLRLWDSATGAALLTCTDHQGSVNGCAFSPDGTRLLSAGEDGTVRLWDAVTGRALQTYRFHYDRINACAFSPDGARLLSAGRDGTLRLWDATTGEALLTRMGHGGDSVFACAFAPDGVRLLSAGRDGTLRLWDVARVVCTGHHGGIRGCAFSPDGTRVLSAGEDGTLRLWDAATGAELLICRGHQGQVSACVFSLDGLRLLSAGRDGTLRLWDASSGAALLTCWGHEGTIYACAFSPDGACLLSAGDGGTLRHWDAATGAKLLSDTGDRGRIDVSVLAPDCTRLLSADRLGTLHLRNTTTGAPLFTSFGQQHEVNACCLSLDGARLLSAGKDGTLRLWDAASGVALLTCIGHQGAVRACAFSPDGTRLLSAGEDGTLRLWDAATGAVLRIHAIQSFPWPGHAVWEPPTNRLIEWSGDAWRWLHWVATDADGWPDPLPLETFGDRPRPDPTPAAT